MEQSSRGLAWGFRSVCLSVYLSVFLHVCLSVCLSICLSFCMSVCLSVCLGMSVCHLMFASPGNRSGDIRPVFLSSLRLSVYLSVMFASRGHRSGDIRCTFATTLPTSAGGYASHTLHSGLREVRWVDVLGVT